MVNNKITVSILEYLGKVEIGVLVLVSVVYDSVYYEGTYFYAPGICLFTIPEDLEEIIGNIQMHEDYNFIMDYLAKKVTPFDEIWNRIDTVDFSRWVNKLKEIEKENKSNKEE